MIFAVLATLSPTLPALAAEGNEAWQFRLTPYLWFAGLDGDISTIPGAPAAPIDISASDALDDTEASLMVLFDAKRGRHGLFADLLYTDVRSDEELAPPPINLKLRSKTETLLFSLAYEYEIVNWEGAVADLLLGARYWEIDSKLRFGGGLGLLDGIRISQHESWVDPFVGAKGRAPLGGSSFFVAGGVLAGGFGVSSDSFYEISANVGYRWSRAISTTVGYRLFDVDYDDDGFVYDVTQEGWQAGLTWTF